MNSRNFKQIAKFLLDSYANQADTEIQARILSVVKKLITPQ